MALEAENLSFENLKEIVDPMICRPISPVATAELPRGSFDILSFPTEDLNVNENPMVHFFDIIGGHANEIDFHSLGRKYKEAIEKQDLQILPEPFGLKQQVANNVQMQMVILKDAEGQHTILKHVAFPDKVKPNLVRDLVFGIPYRAKFMSSPKVGRKVLQYCFENLGGRQFKSFELSALATAKKPMKAVPFEDKEDEDIDAGFDYILKFGPRAPCEMQQLRWQTKAIRNAASPIFGWPVGLVEKALRNLASDGALARKEFQWPLPLTLKYYQPWLMEVLEKVWDFDQSAVIFLGEAGVGKSPLGRSILMAQVRQNKTRFNLEGLPCIRCTPEIDFLRGEQGSVLMGDFLDDTSLSLLSMKMVKAFLDVGLYESMCWARWGATKWVQNEPRAVADNTYDSEIPLPPSFVKQVSFPTFYNMVRPSFTEQASKAHMHAVFKRACFLVNSKEHLYFRKAGINEDPVQRILMQISDYLTDHGKKIYGAFKAGCKEMPDEFEQEVAREQEWLTAIMKQLHEERKGNKHDKQLRQAVRTALFGPEPPVESVTTRVKREREDKEKTEVFKKTKAWSSELKASRTIIDLESSSQEMPEIEQPEENEESKEDQGDMQEDVMSEDIFDHGFGLSEHE